MCVAGKSIVNRFIVALEEVKKAYCTLRTVFDTNRIQTIAKKKHPNIVCKNGARDLASPFVYKIRKYATYFRNLKKIENFWKFL